VIVAEVDVNKITAVGGEFEKSTFKIYPRTVLPMILRVWDDSF
jgi:hypothetical protein